MKSLRDTAKELKELPKQHKTTTNALLTAHDVDKIYTTFKTIEPLETEDGLISMSAIMKANDGSDAYFAIVIFYFLAVHHLNYTKQALSMGPFVPKLMYYFKTYYGIPYEKWDKTDKFMKYALGKPLEHLLVLNQGIQWSDEKIIETREALAYSGKPNTTQLKSGKSCEEGINFIEDWGINTNPLANTGLMSAVPGIILHWWHALDSKRIPDRMILDPYNWDNTPDALEVVSIPSKDPNKDPDLHF